MATSLGTNAVVVMRGHCINLCKQLYQHKNTDRQAIANSLDPNKTLQNRASDQGLHCLPIIQHFLHSSTGGQTDMFKYGKELLRCLNFKVNMVGHNENLLLEIHFATL